MNLEMRTLSEKMIIMKLAIKTDTLGYTLWVRRRAVEWLADSDSVFIGEVRCLGKKCILSAGVVLRVVDEMFSFL